MGNGGGDMNRKLAITIISAVVMAAAVAVLLYYRSVLHSYTALVRNGTTIEGTVTDIGPRLPTRYYEGRKKPFDMIIAYTDPFGFSRQLKETIYFDIGAPIPKKQDTVRIYFSQHKGNTRAVSAYNPFLKKLIPPDR